MESLKFVATSMLIGLISMLGCGGNVVVDGESGGAGGASSVGSTGSVNNSVGVSSAGPGTTVAASSSAGPGTTVAASSSAGPGTTVAVSSSSGGTGVLCGMQTCYPVNVLGAVDLPACCPGTNPNTCGLDVSQVAAFIMFPPGCHEVDRPGNLNMSCPDKTLVIMGMTIVLPGCCSGGMCGVFADFSMAAPGLNFGCADASDVTQSCGP